MVSSSRFTRPPGVNVQRSPSSSEMPIWAPPPPPSQQQQYPQLVWGIIRIITMMIANALVSSLATRTTQPVIRRSFVAAARATSTTSAKNGRTSRQSQQQPAPPPLRRSMSFIFTGRRLEDILKKELVQDKTPTEVADLWYTYHESKINVHGLVIKGQEATSLLQRATSNPFFIQPVFRSSGGNKDHHHHDGGKNDDDDDFGYFMVVSQYQSPCHFLMAYLEDFKRDPTSAQPLLTFSVYDDYAASKDLGLVRAEIINKGIHDDVGRKIVLNMMDAYMRDDEYKVVHAFNKEPETFDLDDFLARQNEKWRRLG
jgi:ATP synthase mitochondrial F1 complex assembly factor 1